MDQIPLVSEQIDDGEKLVARLIQEGFPVTAACWVKESDGGRPWYLYLASPVADRRGPREGYRRIQTAIRQMPPPFWVELSDVKLIESFDPIAKTVTAVRDRVSGGRGTWFQGTRLGELEIDAAYVYGPINVSSSSDAPHGVA